MHNPQFFKPDGESPEYSLVNFNSNVQEDFLLFFFLHRGFTLAHNTMVLTKPMVFKNDPQNYPQT